MISAGTGSCFGIKILDCFPAGLGATKLDINPLNDLDSCQLLSKEDPVPLRSDKYLHKECVRLGDACSPDLKTCCNSITLETYAMSEKGRIER